ncbi:hypothetical protein GGI17_001809 [Coemansia sp. S146]|nr:hypothetical protein GGI17_001809 [Coemansia sp. S146]
MPDPAVKIFEDCAPVYKGFDDQMSSEMWASTIRRSLREKCRHMPSIVQYHLVKRKLSMEALRQIHRPKDRTGSSLIQVIVDQFPVHIFRERLLTTLSAEPSCDEPPMQTSNPCDSSPSTVVSERSTVESAPKLLLESVDKELKIELSSDAEQYEELDGAEAKLAAYTTAAVAISRSVPDPPTKQGELKRSTSPCLVGIEYYEGADSVKDGLCTPPWTWLEGVRIGETLVRGAFNTTLAVSAIMMEAATKLGLTIYMSWQPRQIPAWMQVSCTMAGYIEAQVRVAGFRKMWVIAEVVEQSQPWDLLLGNTLLNAIDIGLVMPITPKRREIKIEEPRTNLAEGLYVGTKGDYGKSLLPTVKEEPPVVITVGDMEIYSTYAIDFKIVAEMDRKPRATDKRLAEALPNTAMKAEHTQVGAEISSRESLVVETGAAMTTFDAT